MFKVVLVRPKYPRNIGMSARAMANYGAEHLILIDPQCEITEDAHEGAARAQKPLDKVEIYPHWEKFYEREPEGLRIAFSRRSGKRRESLDFRQTLCEDAELFSSDNKKYIYLIFGPEDHGLAESDLDFVHRLVHLNMPGEIKSLNLSHAVMVALTLIHNHQNAILSKSEETIKEPFFFPDKALKNWLETLNFDLTTHQKVNAYSTLKRLLLKGIPNPKELRILEMVMQQTIRKLKNNRHRDNDLQM